MKRLILPIFAFALLAIGSAHAADDTHSHGHDHDHHATESVSLQLNDGAKWETDAPLRASMSKIRDAVDAAHPAIHTGTMSDDGYTELADQVKAGVNNMIANCQLPPDADAQLHIVLAELLSGAAQMSGSVESATRKDGAHTVMGVLETYNSHFEDPDFAAIKHLH